MTYIAAGELKQAVDDLKASGCNASFIDYLLVRSANVTQGNTGIVVVSGRKLEPNTNRAKFVYGTGDDETAPYYNPLSGEFLSHRHWTNGPSDTVPRWAARENSPIDTVTGASAKSKTISINKFDGRKIRAFFGLSEDRRASIASTSVWWYRATNLEGLGGSIPPTLDNVIRCFLADVGLSEQQASQLFECPTGEERQRIITVSETPALPQDYLPDSPLLIVHRDSAKSLMNEPRNLIYFGAPGTGKSYELNKLALGADGEEGCFDEANVTRVTFHPDYTYAQFVGCFKPFIEPQIDEDSPASAIRYAPGRIEYRFVPGPFINTYVDAIRHPGQNYLLIIEEINRANPASVFGDVFQLLDRKEDGTSEYSVATSEDLRWYLFKQWKSYLNGIKPQERQGVLYSLDDPEADELASFISLPDNLYIWATMNSADQGVFPMDTAFKRRWDFRYMGIDEGSDVIKDIAVPVGTPSRMVGWDGLRRGINKVLLVAGVNEDKLLGPFFISPSRLRDTDRFTQTFQDKVLLYLFEDAAKTKKSKVFSLAEKEGRSVTYSQVCADFRKRGELAFCGMKELPCLDGDALDEGLEPDGSDGGE